MSLERLYLVNCMQLYSRLARNVHRGLGGSLRY